MGVVLAGGAGSRIGGNKANLRLPGRSAEDDGPTLVEWAAARLAAVSGVEEILVAAGEAGEEGLALSRDLSLSVVADGPGSGPAAGVLGVARSRTDAALLVLACDLPLAPVELLAALAACLAPRSLAGRQTASPSDADLTAAATDPTDPRSMNPTCALWTPRALTRLEQRVATGDFRLYPTLQDTNLHVQAIDAGRFGDPTRVLLNVNTVADWNSARRAYESLDWR